MSCHYIGKNNFIKIALDDLYNSYAGNEINHRWGFAFEKKAVFFLDTESVMTVKSIVNHITRIGKVEKNACIILIDNNKFIASVHTNQRVSIDMSIIEWCHSINNARPNVTELLKACENVLGLNELTNAQRQVLRYLQTGYSLMQISKKLSISNKTVYIHRQAIAKHLSFSSFLHFCIYMSNEFGGEYQSNLLY